MFGDGRSDQLLFVVAEQRRDASDAVLGVELSETKNEQVQRRRDQSQSEQDEGDREYEIAPARVQRMATALQARQRHQITKTCRRRDETKCRCSAIKRIA